MATNYDIDYNDERFAQVETQKQEALTEAEKTYAGMLDQTDQYYQAQIDASKEWAEKQQQLQQDRTDFTIEQIEQQKDQANKDYLKEQSGAYTDWQKQSNKYGVNAEQMASSGLTHTGFSESSQVSMYNTYQNRVATAREGYNNAVISYNNAIKDAQLQNNSALAEIAYNALQQQLELSLQGFQYKNQLIIEQANKKQELDNTYYNRYQDVLAQLNQENALAEEIRQYNESLQLQREQLTEEIRQYEQNYALEIKQYEESIRQFDAEMERLKKKDAEEYALEIQQLELQKRQFEEEKLQAQRDYELKQAQLAEEKRQFDAQLEASKNASSTKISENNTKSDAKTYGTYSNGQPKGITGYGKISDTGDTVVIGSTEYSIYTTSDGKLWYWDDKKNEHVFLATRAWAQTREEAKETGSLLPVTNTNMNKFGSIFSNSQTSSQKSGSKSTNNILDSLFVGAGKLGR